MMRSPNCKRYEILQHRCTTISVGITVRRLDGSSARIRFAGRVGRRMRTFTRVAIRFNSMTRSVSSQQVRRATIKLKTNKLAISLGNSA